MDRYGGDMSQADVETGHHRKVHVGRIAFDPHRLIYATIILMVTLAAAGDVDIAIIDGRGLGDLLAIVFFPLLALALAHSFSDAIDIQIRTGKRLTRTDRLVLLRDGLQYLSVGVPVIILGLVVSLAGGNIVTAVDVASDVYALSLVFWGVFAARAAGLGKWAQVRFGLIYGVLGVSIVVVEYVILH